MFLWRVSDQRRISVHQVRKLVQNDRQARIPFSRARQVMQYRQPPIRRERAVAASKIWIS